MKVAICTPYYSAVTAEYTVSLARMIRWTLTEANIIVDDRKVIPSIELFMLQGSLLPPLRNNLAKMADEWGADFLMWIDADHSFPEDSLLRLLAHNLPIVGVNQATRNKPHRPTARDLEGNPVWTTRKLAERGGAAEVSNTGLAMCLIHMPVIRALRDGKTPLFAIAFWGEGITEGYGEDVFFFDRVRKAGFPVHLDHRLAWDVLHVSQTVVSNADTLGDPSLAD